MLIINNLSVSVENVPILTNFSLSLASGSLHVIMGPNGSGKSTLAFTLMGHPAYQITSGTITLNDINIAELAPDKRAQAGIFLAFQHPYEIPGVTVFNFLKEASYAFSGKLVSLKEFQELVYFYLDLLKLEREVALRPLNYGFSGGEKKKLELLQLLLLQPTLAILDEIDSGLDVDAMKIVAQALAYARKNNPSMSTLLITHYPRFLEYLIPDKVHVMGKGTLIKSGGAGLAYTIEQRGYDAVL